MIIFFIPDSDCGVLKKSDEMEMSSLGLVEICIFFQQRNRFDYSLTPGSKYQKKWPIYTRLRLKYSKYSELCHEERDSHPDLFVFVAETTKLDILHQKAEEFLVFFTCTWSFFF